MVNNLYSLKVTAGLKELSDVEIQEALEELNGLIQDYKKNEKSLSLTKKGCQSLDTPEKNRYNYTKLIYGLYT